MIISSITFDGNAVVDVAEGATEGVFDRRDAVLLGYGFGALTIIKRFEEYGVTVKDVVNCGGIAEKNPFVMQIYADVTNRPMKISRSAHGTRDFTSSPQRTSRSWQAA